MVYYLQAIAAVTNECTCCICSPGLLVSILLLSITLEDALAFVENAPQACSQSRLPRGGHMHTELTLAFFRLAVQFTYLTEAYGTSCQDKAVW
jgi:hypothetical protein